MLKTRIQQTGKTLESLIVRQQMYQIHVQTSMAQDGLAKKEPQETVMMLTRRYSGHQTETYTHAAVFHQVYLLRDVHQA